MRKTDNAPSDTFVRLRWRLGGRCVHPVELPCGHWQSINTCLAVPVPIDFLSAGIPVDTRQSPEQKTVKCKTCHHSSVISNEYGGGEHNQTMWYLIGKVLR